MCTPWCAQHESWGASELKNGSTEKQIEKNGSKDTFHSIPHFLMMEILYIDWSLLIPNVSAQFLSAWTGWSHSGKFGKLFCHVSGPSLKTWGWQLAPQQPKLQFQFSQCAAPSDVILKADVKCQKWSLKTASIKPFIHIHIYIYSYSQRADLSVFGTTRMQLLFVAYIILQIFMTHLKTCGDFGPGVW